MILPELYCTNELRILHRQITSGGGTAEIQLLQQKWVRNEGEYLVYDELGKLTVKAFPYYEEWRFVEHFMEGAV